MIWLTNKEEGTSHNINITKDFNDYLQHDNVNNTKFWGWSIYWNIDGKRIKWGNFKFNGVLLYILKINYKNNK